MEKYIKTDDGLSLWSECFGDARKPAILLIMGAMNQGIHWPDDFCKKLDDAGFFVIRYDHRDTGKSDGVDFLSKPYDLKRLSQDAICVLTEYGIKRANVIGFSMGGYISQIIAIHYPDLVENLVLISTTADHRPHIQAITGGDHKNFILPSPDEGYLRKLTELIKKQPRTKPEFHEYFVKLWKIAYGGTHPFPLKEISSILHSSEERESTTLSPINHVSAMVKSEDRLKEIEKIKARVLIIHGKYDPCLPLEHGEYLANCIPDSQIKLLNMGHFFQWSLSDDILSEVIRFI
ncbi:acetyltransferase [Pectobacterium araliae]|uniref:Alpha/beta hydrolase n=1 Tax=Pectobacterium araliae TaxID=3073862 RepID=A0AAN0K9Z5_9GAMM|nr:alpha/beta hydrolase [Pectobacterium sp. MAFF 302110]GKW22090.1 acetyltransferase [Pectobacterium carotovorum subsp. carotovorum]